MTEQRDDGAAFVYLIIKPTKKMTAKVRQPVAFGRAAKLAWCPISCEKGTVSLADRLVIKTLINNPRNRLNAKITYADDKDRKERKKSDRLLIFPLPRKEWRVRDTCPVTWS